MPSPTPLFEHPVDWSVYSRDLLRLLAKERQVKSWPTFIHDGPPVPKGRPRFAGKTGHTYTPKETVRAEKDLAWVFRRHVPDRPWSGPIALVAVFFVADQRRQDGDNLLKLVLDAATLAGIWHDDSQVVAAASIVDLDPVRPRTVIALAPAVSSLTRRPSA